MPYSEYPKLTFGLTQEALINTVKSGKKPLSAAYVLATQFIAMTPLTTLYAWLQAQLQSETIITKITGKHTKIKLGGITHMTLQYNPEAGVFVPVGEAGEWLPEHPAVELLAPVSV